MEEIRYGDEVIVIDGFYKDCEGFALDCEKVCPSSPLFYSVELNKFINNVFRKTVVDISGDCLKIKGRL
jgi:hypothetical protein